MAQASACVVFDFVARPRNPQAEACATPRHLDQGRKRFCGKTITQEKSLPPLPQAPHRWDVRFVFSCPEVDESEWEG